MTSFFSPALPVSSDTDQQGRVGLHMVALKVHQELRWIFREKPTSDIGIDGEVEIRADSGESHGRLIAVQVKCGPSYLKEQTSQYITYRGNYEHLRYWADFALPVILVLCDPSTNTCWWEAVDMQKVRFHEKGWSLPVQKANVIEASAAIALRKVAARLQRKDFIELALRDWLGWRFLHQMRLASILAQPSDYWWFSHLGAIGDDYYMIDYVYAGVDGFSQSQVDQFIKAIHVNRKSFKYGNVLLAFISESMHHLHSIPDPPIIHGVRVEYVCLLMQLDEGPHLSELGADDALIVEYELGITDDYYQNVTPARKVSQG